MNLIESLIESYSQYSDIIDKVLNGDDVYVRLDEKDYSEEEGSNIYKVEFSSYDERPEDYDNGYNSGWDRGQDEEFDRKQDERFEKATKAYEEGYVFEFNCVKAVNGKIEYTGFCLLKCYGLDELEENLKYFHAKLVPVRTIQSFEDEDENKGLHESESISEDISAKLDSIVDKYDSLESDNKINSDDFAYQRVFIYKGIENKKTEFIITVGKDNTVYIRFLHGSNAFNPISEDFLNIMNDIKEAFSSYILK